jgi:signal transduction histidine kinase
MKSSFAQSWRSASRWRWFGAIALAVGLDATAQESVPARAAPTPSQPSVITNQLDALAPAPRVITNLETALNLTLDQAERGQPVKLLATVTYCHPPWRMLFVQSAELGTFLKIPPNTPSLQPGEVIEIEGSTTSAHGFAELTVRRLKPTGQMQTLTPKNWDLEDILNGRASGQWLQIDGRVLAAFPMDERLLIQTSVGSTNITVYLLNWSAMEVRKLLDARVRITGVLSVQFDDKGRRDGVAVLAQQSDQIQVLEAPHADLLALPVTPIDRLTVSKEGKSRQRVHIQGVLEQRPDGTAVAVHDRTSAVQVQCPYKPGLRFDSGVDVFGYPRLADGELVLKDSVILPTGSLPPPASRTPQVSSNVQPSLPSVETAQTIRRLSKSEAARGYPVNMQGVVTFTDSRWRSLFVQDSTGGIFVTPASGRMRIRPGERVRVRGLTAEGDFAPTVCKATFEVLGEAPMPAPARVGLDELLTGQYDCRWVEIRGVVQSAMERDHRCWLQVMTTQGQIPVMLGPSMTLAQTEQLVDARVTLRGVAGGQFNQQGQIIAFRLHVPDESAILVDEAAPANPFAIPTERIMDLSSYQSDQDLTHRIKIAGRVTSVAQDQTISLQDGSGGMLVRLVRCDRLPCLGEVVEILGYPVAGEFSITLNDAWSRIAGPGGDPPALVMTAGQVLTNEPNAELVQLDARLIQDTWLRPAQVLVLQAGSVVFEAMLPRAFTAEGMEQLSANTQLRVTGVCLLEGGRWGQVNSFRLRVREARDLKVLTQPPWWNLRRLLLTLAITGALGALGLVWGLLTARKNRLLSEQIRERARAEAALQRAHADLQSANDNLEHRVAERTLELREQIEAKDKAHAELAAAQKDLMEASREAGMAEIATGVLHNVGNVLNSLNVSTTIIREKLRRSEFLTLGKVRGLLKEHEADIAAFLTSDPKGKLVPGFIIKLADNIDKELSLLQEEHEQVARNVEHIKEIVAMQQTYARVSGSREELPIASLVDDALQINRAGFEREGIEIVREYSDLPQVTVDKHKVLQILVNLITNAKHALNESGRPDRRLTVKTGMNGNNRLKVTVADNGIGIPPENLTRIFSHGFTTRKTGHGFGLYSGASAAKEMGGQLTAHSEGSGKGAAFVLEIPLDSPNGN